MLNPKSDEPALRAEAQHRLALENRARHDAGWLQLDGKNTDQLLHELQVRHLELEMQHEALQQSNEQLELANQAIELGLQRYTQLYELAPLAYFTLAPDGLVLKANQLGLAQLQRCAASPNGVRFAALVADESLLAFNDFLAQLFTGPASAKRTCELRLRTPAGAPALYAELTGMSQEGDADCNIAMVDVSERIQARLEIERLNQALELQVRQLAESNLELEAFSSSAAHDLQTPLTALDGFRVLLERGLTEDNPALAQHCARRIGELATQMGQLTDGLLALARITSADLRMEHVNLSELAAQVIHMLRESQSERQVSVQIAVDLVAEGDPTLLRQVLVNLLGNAWKFTQHEPAAKIFFGTETLPDGRDAFVVRDNGAGFDMAYAGRLFGTFERLHAQSEFTGTGVGLATVRRIIMRHGGVISAQAAPGQGASFRFTLAPSPPPEPPSLRPKPAAAS